MTAAGALVSQSRATGRAMRGMVTLFAEDGVEEQGDPGGGEEFGVGGALVGGEEHVGVGEVEDGGEEGGVGRGEGAGEAVEGEAGGGEGEPGVDDGRPRSSGKMRPRMAPRVQEMGG